MSSSTLIEDTPDDKDDQLIIIVNADGTITVDPETLQKLIANQHHGSNLSVVRVGDGSSTSDDGQDVNLTVEAFYSGNDPEIQQLSTGNDNVDSNNDVVDPFSQMEPEHIARLESVLQSEQAKEILGTNLTDNQDLNSMLDMLEGKDEVEVPEARVVHNDHSYTSSMPGSQPVVAQPAPAPVSSSPQLAVVHRPLTRGGRIRGRGRGLLTRGGSRSGPAQPQVITSGSQAVIIQSPAKVIQSTPQKTYIVTHATRRVLTQPISSQARSDSSSDVASSSPTTPRLLQRKLIAKPASQPSILKQQTLQQVLSSSTPSIVTSNKDPGKLLKTSGVVKVISSPAPLQNVQKKVVITGVRGGRGRGGRGSRLPRKSTSPPPAFPPSSAATAPATPPHPGIPMTGDEVSAALEAMELSPPLPQAQATSPIKTPSNEPNQEKPLSSTRKKVVIIRKVVGGQTEDGRAPQRGRKSRSVPRPADDDEVTTSPAIIKSPTKSSQVTTPLKSQLSSSPRGSKEGANQIVEEGSAGKKKREKKAPVAPVVVPGPELFSAPDIIRRVSTDTKPPEPATPLLQQPPPPAPPPPPPSVVPVLAQSEEPKVEVQPTHPPFKEIDFGDLEMTPESLLDSIHAEVAKDDSRLLAEALLLDDLTNDDESMSYPGSDKIEVLKVIPQSLMGSPSSTKAATAPHGSQQTPEENPRIRKLPPIELPTTRSASKKAAATQPVHQQQQPPALPQPQQVVVTAAATPPSTEKDKRQNIAGSAREKRESLETRKIEKKYSLKDEFVSDFEDEFDSERESVNSEDDPNRLWCICKKPHNNRFMICCDGCEEWFHGKCVGVTKAMGQQMEQRGIEWSCPNCKVKRDAEKINSSEPNKPVQRQQTISSLECIVCKKPARTTSNYCSDMCIKKHALNSIALLKGEVEGLQPSYRVAVFQKSSGRIISDNNAPTVSNLADWLSENQTYEVHKGSIASNKKSESPTSTVIKKPAKVVVLKQQQLPQQISRLALQQEGKAKVQLSRERKLSEIKPPITPGRQSIEGKSDSIITSTPKQTSFLKSPAPSKQSQEKEKTGPRQTFLTNRLSQGGGGRESSASSKPPVKQIQIIQAQPLPPPPIQTPKGKSKRKDDDTDYTPPIKKKDEDDKPVKKSKVVEKAAADSGKRLSTDGKKHQVGGDKTSGREDKKPDSTSKDSTSTPIDKKKEDKKKAAKTTVERGEEIAPPPASSSEPIRANVKRTIQELLNQRVKQDGSISVPNDLVKDLASSIEDALFAYFKDTGTKYKAKYRSLVFNIKDPKNLTLYKKIVEKAISAEELVRLSPEELASQELAQWREKEAKHQLEIIKKNELDLIQQAKTVVLKSRKGEEVIETKSKANISEIESALNRTAADWELENAVITDQRNDEEKKQLEKKQKEQSSRHERRKSSTSSKDERRRDRSRSRTRKKSRSTSRERRRKDKDREKEKSISKTEETLKEIEEVILQHLPQTISLPLPPAPSGGGADSDLSDREPTSTVEISTPPPPDQEKPPIWQGFLNMAEVTKLCTAAYEVSGSCVDLGEELPEQLECVGRIQPDSVWEYVSRMKKAGTKDIVVIRFHAEGVEEKMNYLSLYSYLNSRNRMAVIGSICKTVKDFYVLPLASHSPIPQVLLPIDGPGFDDYRTHLLLGIIVRSKKDKKPMGVSSTTSSLAPTKKSERSYTPPLPGSGGLSSGGGDSTSELPDSGSTTPPLLPSFPSTTTGLTPPLPDEDEPYSPGEPYSPEDSQTETILVNPDIQKNIEEVNKLIDEKYKQIKSLSQAATKPPSGDEDAPYSPSSSMSPPQQADPALPFLDTHTISLPPNLQDILASIKGTPSLDMKSDPIIKAYTNQGMYYEEEEDEMKEGDDEGEEEEETRSEERTSRDPRQRPEPKPSSKSSLSQLSDTDLVKKASEMEAEPPKYFFPPPPTVPPPVIYAPPPPYSFAPPSPPDERLPRLPSPPPLQLPPYQSRIVPTTTVPLPPRPSRPPGPPPPLGPPILPPREPPPLMLPHRDLGVPPPQLLSPRDQGGPPRQHKWDGGNRPHRGGQQRMQQRGGGGRFRGGFDRGRGGGGGGPGFRGGGGGFRHHRGGPQHQQRFRGQHHRNVQSEWDEEIRKFEQRRAREIRKRKVSRSPSPRRRSRSPKRKSRRASSNSS